MTVTPLFLGLLSFLLAADSAYPLTGQPEGLAARDQHSYSESERELIQAAKEGNLPWVKRLLRHGVDPNVGLLEMPGGIPGGTPGGTPGGKTLQQQDAPLGFPLAFAARQCHLDVLRVLLARGANPSLELMSGETALSLACKVSCEEGAKLLIQRGADLELRERDYGRTVLMQEAITEGHLSIVELLMGAGASLAAHDRTGMTALDLARHWGVQSSVAILSYGKERLIQSGVVVLPPVEPGTRVAPDCRRGDRPAQYDAAEVRESKAPWKKMSDPGKSSAQVIGDHDEITQCEGYRIISVYPHGFYALLGAQAGDLALGFGGYMYGTSEQGKVAQWGFPRRPEDAFPDNRPMELFVKRGEKYYRFLVRRPKTGLTSPGSAGTP